MQSRNEDILTAIADGTSSSELKPAQSREEALRFAVPLITRSWIWGYRAVKSRLWRPSRAPRLPLPASRMSGMSAGK